jgi:flagellar protein FliO/FliZ
LIFTHALTKSIFLRVHLAASLTIPVTAMADQVVPSAPGVSAGTMLQTGLGLLLVFGLLFLGAYLLRKFGSGRAFGMNGPLRVVGGLMISTRERIVLLEVGDVWLVVGVGPGQIRTLHTMPKGEIPASSSTEKPFGQWLKQMIEHKNETH